MALVWRHDDAARDETTGVTCKFCDEVCYSNLGAINAFFVRQEILDWSLLKKSLVASIVDKHLHE